MNFIYIRTYKAWQLAGDRDREWNKRNCFQFSIQGNPKDYVVVGWDTEKGQQIEAIAIKKLAVDGLHPSTGATVRMQYQGQIWKGQILSFHCRLFTLLC